MRKIIVIALVVFVYGLAGCQSSEKTSSKAEVQNVGNKSAKEYVEDNTYIDLDVNSLHATIATNATRSGAKGDDMARMKAALYRFYSHVKLEEEGYVCDLSSANEINVSSTVYTALLNNMNDMNASYKKAKSEEKNVVALSVNKAYLDSLLE